MRSLKLSTLAILSILFINVCFGKGGERSIEYSSYAFPKMSLQMPCPNGAGTIGGHAFQDFNYNGLDDQSGAGIAGIEVHLFTCGLSGESELAATMVTDLNGDYFFSNLTDGQEYRVEFSIPSAQSYLESGFNATDSRTSVQLITSPSCDVNIGMANPDDYCEDDPKLIVPCYVNGDPMAAGSFSATEDALVCFNASNEGTSPTPTTLATAEEVGATWGVTYNKKTEIIYTSAFLKRHVGLGTLGLGGIYQIDMSGASPIVSPFIDLNALGANIGDYSSNADRGLSADINLPSNDTQAFDEVGKKGLGSLTMSKDGNTLYVISLTDKTLYAVDISNGTPTSADLTSYPIPGPDCTGGAFRPFAVQIHNEQIYVGGICDAETSQQKSDLRSIVYRLEGSTFTEVLNFSLDFQKGLASRSCDDDRGWFPWSDQMPEGCFVSGASNIIVHPTPVLSDIEFDANGDMVLGFTDRIGNQVGYLNYGPIGQTELYSAFTGGDILKATINSDGSYTLENNGTAGPNTTVGADNGEGPGGGEFFSFDVFEVAPNIPRPHSETAQGGLALIKGSNQVIGTALDPFGTFVNSGGVNYWNIETGEVRDPGYVVFRSSSTSLATFSKANGLGDIATLCGTAPIELGGRLWVDANTNGVQDPCEGILPNITVTLYDNNTPIGTTSSDSNGEYFFNSTNVTGGTIQPNSDYTIVFGSAEQTQTPLVLLDIYTSTARDIGMSPNNDLNDSDTRIGDVAGQTGAFYIPVTTGGFGAVSHGNDAGFFEIPPPPIANITGQVFNDINKDGLQDANDLYIGGVSITLYNADGTVVATTNTDDTGSYLFENILAGDYYVAIEYETNINGTTVNFDGTAQDAGDDNLDSDFDPTNGQTAGFYFDPAQGDKDLDAGIFQPEGNITGVAFEDVNNNGIQDLGEVGIAGMPVVLQDCAGETIQTTLTDSNGNYQFDNLIAGQYQVFFQSQVNDLSISDFLTAPKDAGDDSNDSDILPTTNTSECFSFNPKDGAIIDAGFYQPTGTIIGMAFEDKNGDGIQDPNETTIAGVTVYLQDCNGTVIATTTTNNNGNYDFGDMQAGNYQMVFDVTTNVDGVPNYQTSQQGAGSHINPTTNESECFSFNPDIGQTVNAGFFQPIGTTTGIAFDDLNGDGIRDPNEGPLVGATVHLQDCTGGIIATTTTDNNGSYNFGDIVLGNYQIVFDVATNANSIADYQTSPQGTDSDINPNTSASTCFAFDPDQGAEIDAGFFQPKGEITGIAFEDIDGDGIQGPNEVGLEGVSVSLFDCNNNRISNTLTDNNGNYSFGNLTTGNYQIVFDISTNANGINNYKISPQDQGGNDQTDSDINAITNASDCISFSPSQGAEIDAGFFEPKGNITGVTFNDLDGDGIQDEDEYELTNVEVHVLSCDGTILFSTFTDENGSYSFDGLSAGNYQIHFSPNTNSQDLTDLQTSPQGQDSDIDPISNSSACFAFDPEQGIEISAGFFQPTGTIEGTVFNDLDGDGMQEPGEGPIAGVSVLLMDCNGTTIASTLTDNNGNYSFGDIKQGNYQVVFDAATNSQNIHDFQTTFQDRGPDDMDSDINPTTNTSDCIAFDPTLGADIDAGFVQPKGEIVGTVFMDTNEDGMQGAGEFGIYGVTIVLIDSNGNAVASTTTNENGNYLFSEVLAGNYQVLVDPSNNSSGIIDYMLTSQDMGNDEFDSDVNPSNGRSEIFSFVPADGKDIDAGLFQPVNPVRVGNLVFKDCNQNGLFDVGEGGMQGFSVLLSGTTDLGENVNLQTATDAFGLYEFIVPRPGTYQLTFIAPDGLTGIAFSPKDVGDDSKDSDLDPTTGIVPSFVVESGVNIDHIDVGVMDITKPTLFNVPPDITVSCNNLPDPPSAVKATDNCDPSVSVSFTEQVNQAACGFTILRTWHSVDNCGNTVEKQQTITVKDEEAPVITLSNPLLAGIPNGGEVTFDCDQMPEFDETDVIVTDNCDMDIQVDFVDLVREEGNCEADGFVMKMTCGWKAVDDCGNESEYLIVINVVDTKAPTLANIPADMTINLEDGQAIPDVPTTVSSTDNCDENVSITFEQTQTEGGPCGYEIIRVWTAKDNCGNKTIEEQKIRITRNCECPEYLTDGRMVVDAACDGSMGGMILLNLTADARHYEFDYTPNLGTPNLLGNRRNDLPPGNYAITITYKGAENCTENLNISIGTMEAGAVSIADSKKANCFQADGMIALSPANYIYEWSDGIVAAQRSDLAAGSYKVNYTDNLGCKGSTDLVVEQPENCVCLNFKLSIDQNNSPSCPGGPDASIVISTQGGKEPINYQWNNGGQSNSLEFITAGRYSVTVTDANGCQIIEEIRVMERESLMATITQDNGVCGEKGNIDLFVSGGTAPYTYLWNNNATPQDLLAVETGVYEVTIQDANSCQTTASTMVNNEMPINIQLTKQLPTCEGEADGKILATVSGGSGTYTYLWSNSATTKDNEGVAAGVYNIRVTDATGCQASAQIEVEEPTGLDLELTPNSPSCHSTKGRVDLLVSGGTAPYSYLWNTGSTTTFITDLNSGTYSVLVTDANGCEALGFASIEIPSPLTTTIENNSPVCPMAKGQIRTITTGGVAPYTYQWNFGATTDFINNLDPGDYTLSVSDANGCISSITTSIIELPLLNVSTTTTEAGCSGKGGDVRVSVMNATPPLTFNWANGATTQDLINVSAGTYEGMVTDANGCSAVLLATVTSAANIEATASTSHPTCFGADNGAIYPVITGGTAPFTYLWNTGATIKDLVNIGAGNYSLTITDGQSCQFVLDAILTSPEEMVIREKEQNPALCEFADGSLAIEVAGGSAPYTYAWNTGATTTQISKAAAGIYQVTVTDSKGCIATQGFTLKSDCTCPESLYTNIMINNTNCGNSDGTIMIMVENIERYTFEWLPNIGAPGASNNERSGLPPGEYRVRVTYAGQQACSEILDIFLGNNEAEKIETVTNIQAACEQANGQIELSPKESIYTWPDGIIGHKRTDLAASTYLVTAMDVNGCMSTIEVVVGQKDCIVCDVVASIAIERVPTCSIKKGNLSVAVTGGTGPYSYQWSSPSIGNNATPTNLLIDTYKVTVTDANNCQAVASITLAEPTCTTTTTTCPVTASVLTVNAKCAGEATGSATIEIIDGKSPFSYAWSNGSNKEAIKEIVAGNYSVTITDASGCSSIEQVHILEPAIAAEGCNTGTTTNPIETTDPIDRPDFRFTSYTISSDGAFANLKWSTKYENLEGHFVIGHSTDGVKFESIGEAYSAQGPALLADYQHSLKIPNYGKNYFKIKYVDIKGDFVYSEARVVFRDAEVKGRVLLYPNPIQEQFTLDFLKPTTASKSIIISDNLGNIIDRVTIPSGTIKYQLNAATYQPGVYIVTIDNALEKDTTLRLVKVER